MASTGQISDNIESYMRIKALSFNRIEYLVSHLQLKQDNNILLSFSKKRYQRTIYDIGLKWPP